MIYKGIKGLDSLFTMKLESSFFEYDKLKKIVDEFDERFEFSKNVLGHLFDKHTDFFLTIGECTFDEFSILAYFSKPKNDEVEHECKIKVAACNHSKRDKYKVFIEFSKLELKDIGENNYEYIKNYIIDLENKLKNGITSTENKDPINKYFDHIQEILTIVNNIEEQNTNETFNLQIFPGQTPPKWTKKNYDE